jgi:hypothetical protein
MLASLRIGTMQSADSVIKGKFGLRSISVVVALFVEPHVTLPIGEIRAMSLAVGQARDLQGTIFADTCLDNDPRSESFL